MPLLKTVFHVHTDYSPDCDTSPENIIDTAMEVGVHCVTITDHDTIAGALRVQHIARDTDVRIIVGEEISTADGHLIGLFLREPIDPFLPVRETAERIREQGGLVAVPHPFNRMFDCGLRGKVHEILDLVDLVEVYNAQNVFPFPNMLSERFARRRGYPAIVGVDAHARGSLGACYQWMPSFEGPGGFLESVRHAQPVRGRHSMGYFLGALQRLLLYKAGRSQPEGFGRNCEQWPPKLTQPSIP